MDLGRATQIAGMFADNINAVLSEGELQEYNELCYKALQQMYERQQARELNHLGIKEPRPEPPHDMRPSEAAGCLINMHALYCQKFTGTAANTAAVAKAVAALMRGSD